MSDLVALLWWLIGAGAIIGFVAAPYEKLPRLRFGLAIAAFAFVGITRSSEGTIVAVEMVAIALLSILLFRGTNNWRRRRALIVCLSAVIANFTATQALSATHYLNSGLWGLRLSKVVSGGSFIAVCFRFQFSAVIVMLWSTMPRWRWQRRSAGTFTV